MKLRFLTKGALLVLPVLFVAPCVGCVSKPSRAEVQSRAENRDFVRNSSSAASIIPEGFGVNIHFTDPRPGELQMLANAGVRWVRMDFKWDLTESAKGTYDFAPYERLLAALAPFGIRALFILDYGNPLYDDGAPPRAEATRQAFSRWAVAAAKHFAGRGVIWEIYNEPNNKTFWPPQPNVNEYAALALVVGRAFRAAVPNEKLVGPAIAEMDFPFLEGCFKAGLLEYWSAVSVHPYLRSNPELAAREYYRLREMIKTYASGKPIAIFSSEWGYSSAWPDMSEEKQGWLLARQWLSNSAYDISMSIWYDWRDDGSDPNDPEHHFGMVSNSYYEGREPVYAPKPAYLAAKALTSFFGGYRFERRLDVGSAEDHVLVFVNGNSQRVAAWTTASNSRQVVIALSRGQYRGTRHTGEDLGLVTADQKGLTINLTPAPVYFRSHE